MPSDMQLLSKITVGGQELSNRVVLAPMTRARVTPKKDAPLEATDPNQIMVDYYVQRASCGLILTEATAVSEMGSGWKFAPHIRTPDNVNGWKKVTDAVHEAGGIIYLQLWHMGRQAHSSFHPTTGKTYSASNIPMSGGKVKTLDGGDAEPEVPSPLTLEEIEQTIKDFVQGAKLAKEAGFDGVEIHGANGYLLDQFFQSCSNVRTDKYGGSMENRVRILKDIVEAMIEEGSYPANRIGFRISPNGAFGGMGSEDNGEMFPFVAKTMNSYGLAFIHVMDGLGFGYHEKCPPVTVADIRKNWDGPIVANVGLTRDVAEGMIRSGAADLAAFGRPYIANPDLVERFANDWPLAAEAPYMDWWHTEGAKGYTDWPTYKPEHEEESA